MREQGTFRIERLELYRTALEFCRIAKRVAQALPIHKHETKILLVRDSREIADKIARGTAELSRQEAYSAYRLALRSAEHCHDCLDRLLMVHLGGFPDVTAGLEMLERLNAGIAQLVDDAREKGAVETDEDDECEDESESDCADEESGGDDNQLENDHDPGGPC